MGCLKFSKDEIDQEISSLKKIYARVKVFDADYIAKIDALKNNKKVDIPFKCFAFWDKQIPCRNCIVLNSFNEKKDNFKIEEYKDKYYLIQSKYIEVDEKPCVLELVQIIDSTFIDDMKITAVLGGSESDDTGLYSKMYKDSLTGAYNRRFYEEKYKNHVMYGRIALLDIDDFKMYNDLYGHNDADAILINVVSTIKRYLRKKDIIIRYEGDQFIIIFDSMEAKDFDVVLSRIKMKINENALLNYRGDKISVSIGGVLCDNKTISEALENAKIAVHKAKTIKNTIVTNNNNKNIEKAKKNILICENDRENAIKLKEILEDNYNLIEAKNGEECIDSISQYSTGISLILFNKESNKNDEYEALEYLRNNHFIDDIPFVVIVKKDDVKLLNEDYSMGAVDYILTPFDKDIVNRRISTLIKLYDRQKKMTGILIKELEEKDKSGKNMINMLSHIVEFRSHENGPHVKHVSEITEMLLKHLLKMTNQYKLTKEDIENIKLASALHDIGKIGIDENLLNKPGKLTKEEFEVIKTHTTIGAHIIDELNIKNDPLVNYTHDICRWHHERYDGKGYPDGLKGEEIPICAQVTSVADVYDALVSDRCYKKAVPHEEALAMILDGQCGVLNPLLLLCLKEIKDQIKELYTEN